MYECLRTKPLSSHTPSYIPQFSRRQQQEINRGMLTESRREDRREMIRESNRCRAVTSPLGRQPSHSAPGLPRDTRRGSAAYKPVSPQHLSAAVPSPAPRPADTCRFRLRLTPWGRHGRVGGRRTRPLPR